jgi:hypothetical protein
MRESIVPETTELVRLGTFRMFKLLLPVGTVLGRLNQARVIVSRANTLTRFEAGYLRRRLFGAGRKSSTPAFLDSQALKVVGVIDLAKRVLLENRSERNYHAA